MFSIFERFEQLLKALLQITDVTGFRDTNSKELQFVKHLYGIVVTDVWDKSISFRLVILSNASSYIIAKDLGNIKVDKELHPPKQLYPIFVSVSGNLISLSLEQFVKPLTASIDDLLKSTFSRFEQRKNALCDNVFREEENKNSLNPQFAKASSSIVSILLNSNFSRLLQPEKAVFLTTDIVSGNSILDSLSHPEKQLAGIVVITPLITALVNGVPENTPIPKW